MLGKGPVAPPATGLLRGADWHVPRAGHQGGATHVVVVCLPPGRGAQRSGLKSVVADFPETPVVAVVDILEPVHLQRLVRDGARGIVGFEHVDARLLPAVDAVRAGMLCLPPEIGAAVVVQSLTAREKQVLSLVVMGLTNAEIAARLYVSEGTIKAHLGAAFRKLGVRNRAEAAQILSDPAEGLGVGVLTLGATPIRQRDE